MIIKKIIKYLLIIFSSSFLISFTNISRNFKEDILRLVFAIVAFVGSAATYGSIDGSFGTSGSVSGSGVGIETGFK